MSEVKGVQPGKVKLNEGEISRRELLKRLSPLGMVRLDSGQCTGCGLCAAECPTEALWVSSDQESGAFQLLFKHRLCLACNRCAEICPERCLSVERPLEPDVMDGQAVLFEDTIVRCRECGRPVGPRTMIDRLRARVVTGQNSLFELCPDCRVQFSLLR